MSKNDVYELEDILLDFTDDYLKIKHPPTMVFTSFNSKFLDLYTGGLINSNYFEDNGSLEGINEEYVKNYRRFLGFRYIHLGSLDMAGFMNSNYDLSFGFKTDIVLEKPHLICDHDILMDLLLYGQDTQVNRLYQENYSQHHEILLRELDLNKANLVISYSDEATQKVERIFNRKIKLINMSKIRNNAIELYSK